MREFGDRSDRTFGHDLHVYHRCHWRISEAIASVGEQVDRHMFDGAGIGFGLPRRLIRTGTGHLVHLASYSATCPVALP